MKKLSHVDKKGKANMVDVGYKPDQLRIARATGFIKLSAETIKLIKQNEIKKGDVLTIAEIAGIQAAKRTPDLIPLCHPLQLTKIDVKAKIVKNTVEVNSEVRCIGQTGVEMEALTAVSVALLTVYDMCKAVDKKMEISNTRLIEKTKTDISQPLSTLLNE
jgi:cyclic pyranopterin phosphate synthase